MPYMKNIISGATRKAQQVDQALFEYFVDVRSALKGRFPKKLLQTKAKELYEVYVKAVGEENAKTLKFSDNGEKGIEEEEESDKKEEEHQCPVLLPLLNLKRPARYDE